MPVNLKTIIVDDEPLACDRLEGLLKNERGIEVVAICEDGEEAIKEINTRTPDLVFLDIQMPEIDGFDVLSQIKTDELPVIIFVTAYDEYALKAFEVHAIDYLLKPFDDKRFNQALTRAKEFVAQSSESDFKNNIEDLVTYLQAEKGYTRRLMVKNGDKIIFLNVENIDWIEAAGNYIQIHAGETTYMLRETMLNMEKKLDPEQFVRIHRSTILNIERIKALEPWFHGDYKVKLKSGKELTMSRNYNDLLKKY